jgi:hypothetical protein
MIVATVYASKAGSIDTGICDPSDYGPAQVASMRRQFERNLTRTHDFVCLADRRAPYTVCRPLRQSWGGWWSKLELFRQPAQVPILYCDLDNVLLGNVNALANPGPGFWMAQDWDYDVPNSSLMWWQGDYRWIYERFMEDPAYHASRHTAMPNLGDQSFIAECLAMRGIVPRYWQRELPAGFFRSRWDASEDRLTGASMVLWHGRPKPWQFGCFPEGSGIDVLQKAMAL